MNIQRNWHESNHYHNNNVREAYETALALVETYRRLEVPRARLVVLLASEFELEAKDARKVVAKAFEVCDVFISA